MENQTAVEWLVKEILVKFEDHYNDDFLLDYSKSPKVSYYNAFIDSTDLSEYVNKAKEMEKEQIINAAYHGVDYEHSSFDNAEQYYNETYGKTN